jgi:hypothetical protein
MSRTPQRGDFVRVRTQRWLVEDERSAGEKLTALRLACVDDDAQDEVVEILWDAELDACESWARRTDTSRLTASMAALASVTVTASIGPARGAQRR